jgi:hypothetical protein
MKEIKHLLSKMQTWVKNNGQKTILVSSLNLIKWQTILNVSWHKLDILYVQLLRLISQVFVGLK